MIILDGTKSLEVVLSGAVTTNQLQWNSSWVERYDKCGLTVNSETDEVNAAAVGLTNNTTNVTMVGVPSSAPDTNTIVTRGIETIEIYNADTVSATVIVQTFDGTNRRIRVKTTLDPNSTLHYEEDHGWYTTTISGGNVIIINSVSSIAIGDTVTGGTHGALLYTDYSGNLANSILNEDSGGNYIFPTDGKFISSANGNIQIDFGSGTYMFLTTDAGAGNKGSLYMDNTNASLASAANSTYAELSAGSTNPITLKLDHSVQTIKFDAGAGGHYQFSSLTASTVPYIDASTNLVSSAVTPTELGYVHLVTSPIQTQLNAKAPLASPTFTGNVTLNSNVTFTPTVNNTLTGSNARIPSHTTANIVFTNASLTSIGSANNGGVSGGHTICITNETGASITIVNNYGSAAAGEAIFTGVSGDQILPNHASIWLQYDATGSAWVSIAGGLIPVSTGISGLGTGIATWLATPSSANLAAAVTGTTGTGNLVFADSPTFTTKLTSNEIDISGTAGSGFINLIAQSSNASAPSATGLNLFSGSTGNLRWAKKNGTDTYVRGLVSTLTADRDWTFPDVTGTVALIDGGQTFTSAIWNATIIGTSYGGVPQGAWTDWSGSASVVGISSLSLNIIFYQQIAPKTTLLLVNISGAGTGTTLSLTLPNTSARTTKGICMVSNNGGAQTTGEYSFTASSNSLSFFSSPSGGAFTGTGTRSASFSIIYENT